MRQNSTPLRVGAALGMAALAAATAQAQEGIVFGSQTTLIGEADPVTGQPMLPSPANHELLLQRLRNHVTSVVTHFGDKVYRTIVPRNVRLAEAPSHGLPAMIYDFDCPGARAYIALAGEMLRKYDGAVKAA